MKHAIRILLVEDDPTSRAVLAAGLRALPADIDAVPDIRTAMQHVARHRYDLWLLDAHLPDGTGVELLARLRTLDAGAIALAHTASSDAALAHALRAAGFIDVLIKPLPAGRLRGRVRLALDGVLPEAATAAPPPSSEPQRPDGPVLDDAVAIAALGGQAHVAAMRALFATELAGYVELAAADGGRLHDALHRLRASCGFVGAVRLGEAAAQLRQRADAATRATFLQALEDTRAALDRASIGACA